MMAKFITLEGGEGSGKSTQIRMLADYLTQKGIDFIKTREPGGSDDAEEIRNVILSGSKDKWDSVSETLLFSAARRNHLTKLIFPALKEGKWVICDRFADSTMAYQGYGRADGLLQKKDIEAVYHLVAGDFKPDLTFILDIDPKDGLKRALARGENNRMEDMDLSFHENLRNAFLDIAKQEPERCVIIDASKTPNEVHKQIIFNLESKFNDLNR
ncbi:MAG: dTMP kinase [Alphaproteobacteria bacterium]